MLDVWCGTAQIKTITPQVNCQDRDDWVAMCNRNPDTKTQPHLKGHKVYVMITHSWQQAPPDQFILTGTLRETRARRGPHIDALTASFKCHVTAADPRGRRAGLTGLEDATHKLSGLSSICWVWLVESTFIFLSVRSPWFYLTFSQERRVIADVLLAFCTRSCD